MILGVILYIALQIAFTAALDSNSLACSKPQSR